MKYPQKVSKLQNYTAIVLYKKKRKQHVMCYLLCEDGMIRKCMITAKKLSTMKHGAYLELLSEIVVSLGAADGDWFYIVQIDGISMKQHLMFDMRQFAYLSFFSESAAYLFMDGMPSTRVFRKVRLFLESLSLKPIPLATMVIVWQLLVEAGFFPSAKALASSAILVREMCQEIAGYAISDRELNALIHILSYRWQIEEVLRLKKEEWMALEYILRQFLRMKAEAPMHSIDFLETMSYSVVE